MEMSYESPIEIVCGRMKNQLENDVYSVIQSYGIKVDKDELIKALEYDRNQYQQGYADAKAELMPKWIPVMEKLPTPWKDVLTTYEFEGRRYVQTAEYAGQNDENGHPLFCSYSDEYAPRHHEFIYIAWMPLPEPIKRIELG